MGGKGREGKGRERKGRDYTILIVLDDSWNTGECCKFISRGLTLGSGYLGGGKCFF